MFYEHILCTNLWSYVILLFNYKLDIKNCILKCLLKTNLNNKPPEMFRIVTKIILFYKKIKEKAVDIENIAIYIYIYIYKFVYLGKRENNYAELFIQLLSIQLNFSS